MRFNCHTHIFNLKSVFTAETVQTFINRLSREGWPQNVVDAVTKLVMRALSGENLDDVHILQGLITELKLSTELQSALAAANAALPASAQITMDGNLEGLAIDALEAQLTRFENLITDANDARTQTLNDLADFVVVALRPSVGKVADELFLRSGPDVIVVALMMDITKGGANDEDLYIAQLEATSNAALAYPGRLLPFVAINTRRATHLSHLDYAFTQRGFVGVKLYPSLGYGMDSPEMDQVFSYCVSHDAPLLMHCNKGGFFFDASDIAFCDPAPWGAILAKYPTLRVCFAHFGGYENLLETDIVAGSWTTQIIDLMRRFPGVYTDIAYHTGPMAGGDAEKNYFRHMTDLLADPVIGQRILFGSDYFLVRQQVREDNLWNYFSANFTPAQFDAITQTNPIAYLGMPAADGTGARPNIQRHLAWLAQHRTDVQRIPAGWVIAGTTALTGQPVAFFASALGPAWSVNTPAHVATWQYIRAAQMYPSQQQQSFNACGTILLRELMYWNKEHESADIFSDKCKLVAMGLDDALNAAGATYESGGRDDARSGLADALASGDTALHAFASAVDDLYHFPKEISPS